MCFPDEEPLINSNWAGTLPGCDCSALPLSALQIQQLEQKIYVNYCTSIMLNLGCTEINAQQ